MNQDAMRTAHICGRFSPGLTVVLVLLNVPPTYWHEIHVCVCGGYGEEDWPEVLRVCGVPESHIPYTLHMVGAESLLPTFV